MGEVIAFNKLDPHATGEAVCISCKHEFIAVAPVGEVWFDCPECGIEKATWKYVFKFKAGTEIRVCACGNELFYLTREGHACALCGKYQQYD